MSTAVRERPRAITRAALVLRHAPISVWVSLGIITLFVVVGIIGPYIAPQDPTFIHLDARLVPPSWMDGGSSEYFLGTDQLGRDIFSRIIVGARVTLVIVTITVTTAAFVGAVIGMASGISLSYPAAPNAYRWIDAFFMRTIDLVLSVPIILVALLLVVLQGPSVFIIVSTLLFFLWASYARVARGAAASECSQSYVDLAVLAGVGPIRLAFRHILPNILSPLVVLATLQVGFVILLAAALDFLGAGVPPPRPTWGGMVADGRAVLSSAWWVSAIPGFCIAAVVFAANTVGDWLRDTLDPQVAQLEGTSRV